MSKIGSANLAQNEDDQGDAPEAFEFIEDTTPSALEAEMELANRQFELSKYSIEELEAEIDSRRPNSPEAETAFNDMFGGSMAKLNGLKIR